jgi:hypothetical protein
VQQVNNVFLEGERERGREEETERESRIRCLTLVHILYSDIHCNLVSRLRCKIDTVPPATSICVSSLILFY